MRRRRLAVTTAVLGAGVVLVLAVGRHDVAGALAGAVLAAYVAITVLLLRRGGDGR